MNKVNEGRMAIRVEYARDTDQLLEKSVLSVGQYADWMEIRLSKIRQIVLGKGSTSERMEEIKALLINLRKP